MSLPSVRQIECLVAVAEALNFSQAAAACHITQPALSAQIRQLESLLGLRLFERDRRRVLPTVAGAALAEKGRMILAELRDFADAALAFKEPLSGTLRLGVIPTVAPYVLPRALKEVHRRHPQLRLLLREGQTARLTELLFEGSLDLVLLALEADLGAVETLALFDDPFVLAVPTGHRLQDRKRVSERDLFEEQVLLLDDGHCLRDQALSICDRAGACELGDFRASSLTTLVQMVSGGVGVTLLPEMSLKVEAGRERRLKLVPFGAKNPSRTIGLAWRPSSIRKSEFHLLGTAILEGLGRTK
ncbi:MAG: hydrogen peroxide-inducible genes activator [Planctomycetes bacterium]|nr:hydrogen peroxide-inducible genes activator [Planctomycetota bacterium]